MYEGNSSQSWYQERYEHNEGFVTVLGVEVMALSALQEKELNLDLDCKHGKLIKKEFARSASDFDVHARAEQFEGSNDCGLFAYVENAIKLIFKFEFDTVFPNAVLHWFEDVDTAITDLWHWYFRLCKDYNALLETTNSKITYMKWFQRPTPFLSEIDIRFETLIKCLLNLVAPEDREVLLVEVREDLLGGDLKDAEGNWFVDYVHFRFQDFLI